MEHVINSSFSQTVYYSEESKEVDCKSFMFGKMVELAQGTVECYHSDFYYDAIFLKNLVLDKPTEFYYLFGNSGTTIVHKGESNLSPYNLAMSCRKYSRPFVYKVVLNRVGNWDSKAWYMEFTCVATDQESLPEYKYTIGTDSSYFSEQSTP